MRALRELAWVILAGFAAFFGGLLTLAGLLVLWLLGLASALMLMVAAFAGAVYCFTGKAHDGHIALAYLGYAAVPFVMAFIFHYYRGKISDERQQQRMAANISNLRITRDADF